MNSLILLIKTILHTMNFLLNKIRNELKAEIVNRYMYAHIHNTH